MGEITGFLKYEREEPKKRPVLERLTDYGELYQEFSQNNLTKQAARCMDCGVPFCHSGCPLGNRIPDFNDAVFKQKWQEAYNILTDTNNFPEFTGRICPAPCEASCVLGINNLPVTIENIEKQIIETAFKNGWVHAQKKKTKSGYRVAVVGSGPAGLAAADQLNKAGHFVTVFERNDKLGGLLRYGIPDFKLDKSIIDRRIAIMKKSGIEFRVNANVGNNVPLEDLTDVYDAILLSGGSTVPRNIDLPGRELKGIHFAMEFLEQNNRMVDGESINPDNYINVKSKHVVVLGGGDTGADCVGTSNRKSALSVSQLELMPKPPDHRSPNTPWPMWPYMLRTSSSHEEGGERQWAINTKEFVGNNGILEGIKIVDLDWKVDQKTQKASFVEKPETERIIPADFVFIAAGFLYPEKKGMLEQFGVELDQRGNIKTTNYQSSIPNVFAAGDMRRGQSLVVWAISEGREAANAVDNYLVGSKSFLKLKDRSIMAI